MVTRPEVIASSIDLPPAEALQAVLESPYTRYPVYRESLDNVVGVLHVRDLIEAMHDRGLAAVDVEELLGEIEDEFDLPDETVERVDDDTIRIDGTFPIDDFNEQFDVELPHEDYHTVAGFVFGLLGRGAEPGDEVGHDGLVFRVDSIEGQRIDRLTVQFRPQVGPAPADGD